MFVLAWWFDWLPHHGLEETQQREPLPRDPQPGRLEWLLTPLLLSQNYHLVHHLHPSIPFYRYVATWRRNEEAYLERDAAIATVFGQQLDAGRVPRVEAAQRQAGPAAPGADAEAILERRARGLPPRSRSPASTG